MNAVFIVFGESGKWDSYEKHVVAVFNKESAAVNWARKAQEKVDWIYARLKPYADLTKDYDSYPFDWFDLFSPPQQVLDFYSDMSELLVSDPDPGLKSQLDTEWFELRLEARKKANPYDLNMTVDRYDTTKYFVVGFELDPTV